MDMPAGTQELVGPHTTRLQPLMPEERRVFQQRLCRHDALHACVGNAVVHILQVANVAVGKHRDADCLSYSLKNNTITQNEQKKYNERTIVLIISGSCSHLMEEMHVWPWSMGSSYTS